MIRTPFLLSLASTGSLFIAAPTVYSAKQSKKNQDKS